MHKDIVMKQRAAGNFTVEVLVVLGNVTLDKLQAFVPAQLKSIPADILGQILITLYISFLFLSFLALVCCYLISRFFFS